MNIEITETKKREISPDALLSALRESLREDEKRIEEINRIADEIYLQLNELKKV